MECRLRWARDKQERKRRERAPLDKSRTGKEPHCVRCIRSRKEGVDRKCRRAVVRTTMAIWYPAAPIPLSTQFLGCPWPREANKCQVPNCWVMLSSSSLFYCSSYSLVPKAPVSSLFLKHLLWHVIGSGWSWSSSMWQKNGTLSGNRKKSRDVCRVLVLLPDSWATLDTWSQLSL